MKKNKILIILSLLVCTSIVLICNKSSDNTTLDEVRLKDIDTNKGMYAIMIQQEGENYIPYDQETWPESGYTFNKEKSGCLDSDDKKLTNVKLDFIDGKVKLETSSTGYCYIYFDKEVLREELAKICKDKTMENCMTDLSSSYSKIESLKNSNKGDLQYRYVETQENDTNGKVNNYVCFGSNDCKASITNTHLYRIIGITKEGNLKIQKNSSITASKWNTSYQSDINWPNSTMYTSTLMSTFYGDDTYVSQDMKYKIDQNHKWNTGDVNGTVISTIGTGNEIYQLEYNSGNSTHTGEVGLAYLSDYYFAYNEGGTKNCINGEYCKSWMIPSDNITLWNNKESEWTMSRYGGDYGNYYAWRVRYDGNVSGPRLDDSFAVRPVFYLKSDVKISGGAGTLESPYILSGN